MEEVEMAGSLKGLSCITYIWNPKKVKPVRFAGECTLVTKTLCMAASFLDALLH